MHYSLVGNQGSVSPPLIMTAVLQRDDPLLLVNGKQNNYYPQPQEDRLDARKKGGAKSHICAEKRIKFINEGIGILIQHLLQVFHH